MLCGGGSAARKFHLVIIYSFPCLWGTGMALARGWGLPSDARVKLTWPPLSALEDYQTWLSRRWGLLFIFPTCNSNGTALWHRPHVIWCVSEHLCCDIAPKQSYQMGNYENGQEPAWNVLTPTRSCSPKLPKHSGNSIFFCELWLNTIPLDCPLWGIYVTNQERIKRGLNCQQCVFY